MNMENMLYKYIVIIIIATILYYKCALFQQRHICKAIRDGIPLCDIWIQIHYYYENLILIASFHASLDSFPPAQMSHLIIIIIMASYIAHMTWRSWCYPIITLALARRPLRRSTISITWVECGKCRSMSCQRTLVPRRVSNREPCDWQSGDVSTRPWHLYIYHFSNLYYLQVFDFFKKAVAEQYPLDESRHLDPYEQDKEAHESFMKSRSSILLGRKDILEKVGGTVKYIIKRYALAAILILKFWLTALAWPLPVRKQFSVAL